VRSTADVVLDVDTGVDDALALILAVRTLTVRAVTCTYGNTGVDQVVANTLRVLDALGSPVPVGVGAAGPLSGAPVEHRGVHGRDGLGDLGLPPPRGTARATAAEVPDGATVLALGPLTTLARLGPGLGRIGHLVVSGGMAGPDPNLDADPEAAAVVLAGVRRVTVYGPVFADVPLRPEDVAELRASADPAARLAGRLASRRLDRGAGLGDAGAVAAVLRPDLLTTRPGECCGAPVELAEAVDGEGARRVFLAALRRGR
jgi:pyrimidine-specific ribonucleoside hydrolase